MNPRPAPADLLFVRPALVLLLLAAPAPAGELLERSHVWRGVVEIRAEAPGDVQVERVEFVAKTEPPRQSVGRVRLDLEMGEASGEYRLDLDHTELGRAGDVAVLGEGAGALHPRVEGWIEPRSGEVRLTVRVEPEALLARTTLSGVEHGRFRTWRTVTSRAALLGAFRLEGRLEDGRRLEGERRWEDRVRSRERAVAATWRLERVEPAVRGRVLDHRGRPVGGLRVVARATNPRRVRERLPPVVVEGRTDAEGRFSLGAFPATWSVEIPGELRDGVVVSDARPPAVVVRADHVPEVEVAVDLYRLDRLPDPRLLRGHFRGDVAGYLGYLRERHQGRRFDLARVP